MLSAERVGSNLVGSFEFWLKKYTKISITQEDGIAKNVPLPEEERGILFKK